MRSARPPWAEPRAVALAAGLLSLVAASGAARAQEPCPGPRPAGLAPGLDGLAASASAAWGVSAAGPLTFETTTLRAGLAWGQTCARTPGWDALGLSVELDTAARRDTLRADTTDGPLVAVEDVWEGLGARLTLAPLTLQARDLRLRPRLHARAEAFGAGEEGWTGGGGLEVDLARVGLIALDATFAPSGQAGQGAWRLTGLARACRWGWPRACAEATLTWWPGPDDDVLALYLGVLAPRPPNNPAPVGLGALSAGLSVSRSTRWGGDGLPTTALATVQWNAPAPSAPRP